MRPTRANPWNPVTHPYRVVWVLRVNDRLTRWRDEVEVYATLEEAQEAFRAPSGFPGVMRVRLYKAINPETWCKNGAWKQLESREPYRRKKPAGNSAIA